MEASLSAGLKVFESGEWENFIVQRKAGCIWFGFGGQKTISILCFFLVFAFFLLSVGIFIEGEGLRMNLKDATTSLAGLGALVVALLFAWGGTRLLKSTNRIGMLDLEKRCFSTIDQKDGKTDKVFSCQDLYIHLAEVIPDDSHTKFHGKITIAGPERPDGVEASPELHVTIFHYLRFEDLFKAVRELEKAASWKGIVGDKILVSLYRSDSSGQQPDGGAIQGFRDIH